MCTVQLPGRGTQREHSVHIHFRPCKHAQKVAAADLKSVVHRCSAVAIVVAIREGTKVSNCSGNGADGRKIQVE